MPSKYRIILEMASQTARNIASNADQYTDFLITAANNYKYSFKEQLLIHAQKPDATACAEIDTWNKLGRWVNKGTKGIALLIDRDVPYKLRHVFDISDTNSRAGRNITLWQMKPEYEYQNRRGNSEGNAKGSGCGCKGRTESGGDCPSDCHSRLQSGCCGGESCCCGNQGDCSGDESIGCGYRCRWLGRGRGRRGYLFCCLDRLLLLRHFLFKRGYRLRKDDAAGHSGNQHGLPERAGCHQGFRCIRCA